MSNFIEDTEKQIRATFGPPKARLTQIGKSTWRIEIIDGITVYGPDGIGWRRHSYKRAVKKGLKELTRYVEDKERRRNITEITL